MQTNFFENQSYFIDEKVNFFKFENSYQIFNDKGENIGAVNQKLSFGQKILRLFINKQALPFYIEINDTNGRLVSSLSRGFTLGMSKIVVKNEHGQMVGSIKQKFKLFKPTFHIFNAQEAQIAEINGDWKGWDFKIIDQHNNQIGTISKKWGGALKEIFTSADKYNVSFDQNYTDTQNKMLMVSAAITIDMVHNERK
jgi:uncharacterized protein YxjI